MFGLIARVRVESGYSEARPTTTVVVDMPAIGATVGTYSRAGGSGVVVIDVVLGCRLFLVGIANERHGQGQRQGWAWFTL